MNVIKVWPKRCGRCRRLRFGVKRLRRFRCQMCKRCRDDADAFAAIEEMT